MAKHRARKRLEPADVIVLAASVPMVAGLGAACWLLAAAESGGPFPATVVFMTGLGAIAATGLHLRPIVRRRLRRRARKPMGVPTIVLKPKQGADFYIVWSPTIDAPLRWGDRTDIGAYLLRHGGGVDADIVESRLAHADLHGTSSKTGDLGYQHTLIKYLDTMVPRDKLTELCTRLGENPKADVSDLEATGGRRP